MNNPIPFFYYDILSRMIPGAATLAVLLTVPLKLPEAWMTFLGGQQSWKAVVVPLLVGAACYVIGVIYEAFDYSLGVKGLVLGWDDKAFAAAWAVLRRQLDKDARVLSSSSGEQVRRFRFQLWDSLVFQGGRESGLSAVFAHCHRYQAEHKMFLHLIYPTIVLAIVSLIHRWRVLALSSIVIIPIFFYFSYRRNERRWLQTLAFCRQLDLIESCAHDCLDPTSQATPAAPLPK